MPKTALDSKVAGAILLLNMLGEVVMDQGHHFNEELKRRKNKESPANVGANSGLR